MPLDHSPFTQFDGAISRPVLHIKIINPHTNKSLRTYGIIDTGADECSVPAKFASILGHNLQAGPTHKVGTGNGETIAYKHTTKFEIYHPETDKLLYVIDDTPIDFMPNLDVVLLGTRNFLSQFILHNKLPSPRVFNKISG